MYKKFQGFCKTQNRRKTALKYLINRNKKRIKTVSKTYFNLLYYLKTIFNGNFKHILKKKKGLKQVQKYIFNIFFKNIFFD